MNDREDEMLFIAFSQGRNRKNGIITLPGDDAVRKQGFLGLKGHGSIIYYFAY